MKNELLARASGVQQSANYKQICTLTNLCDKILLRLMNCEI